MAGETILVVDDDSDIREIISLYLEREGYNVILASDGKQALEHALSTPLDLIVLDMVLPYLDGIEVCQEIRKTSSTPIIFLSSKSTAEDKSIGLIAGGDDYMGKPFESIELVARVKAHLRRNRLLDTLSYSNSKNSIITYPGITINLDTYSIVANGQPIIHTNKEFQLLSFLMQNPNTVYTNEQLYYAIWGTESYGDIRTVMVHISNIRKKIELDPQNPSLIQTIKGVGYKFCS
ncbi:MAG: DNA-binding response regulator [Firmicutes bacterium HGW-Firmicutes-7]|nr:MAG: DNA-binding response regulator [Firmicutes bacterium HGW-Firmicutes-7]